MRRDRDKRGDSASGLLVWVAHDPARNRELFLARLAAIRQHEYQILRECGYPRDEAEIDDIIYGSYPPRSRPVGLSPRNETRAALAESALKWADWLEEAVREGNAARAAMLALSLGSYAGSLLEDANEGKALTATARAARSAGRQSQASKQRERWKDWQSIVERDFQRWPRYTPWTKELAAQRVLDELQQRAELAGKAGKRVDRLPASRTIMDRIKRPHK